MKTLFRYFGDAGRWRSCRSTVIVRRRCGAGIFAKCSAIPSSVATPVPLSFAPSNQGGEILDVLLQVPAVINEYESAAEIGSTRHDRPAIAASIRRMRVLLCRSGDPMP